jgi:hypothetical protein
MIDLCPHALLVVGMKRPIPFQANATHDEHPSLRSGIVPSLQMPAPTPVSITIHPPFYRTEVQEKMKVLHFNWKSVYAKGGKKLADHR